MISAEPTPFPPSDRAGRASRRHIAHVDGKAIAVTQDDKGLHVAISGPREQRFWPLHQRDGTLTLEWPGCSEEPQDAELLAALEAAFQFHPEQSELLVSIPRTPASLPESLLAQSRGPAFLVTRPALWQQPRLWLSQASHVPAAQKTSTEDRQHPRRPPKPQGTVYQRDIPWLGQTLRFRTVDRQRDLPLIHRWMNDPVVAHFWQEDGDVAKHRAYLDRCEDDPHVTNLIGCFGDEPFGYFEVYWAKEDRIAPFCDAGNHDRGWHVLIGEKQFRGRPFLTAWMPSISHYLFLDNHRTERLVIEPRADNAKMRRSLARCGYDLLKEFDFPHKRAVLGVLPRARFFDQALWIPQTDVPAPGTSSH